MEDRRYRGNKFREGLSIIPVLNEDETAELLYKLGLNIETDTMSHFMVLCPFHGNRNTPSMEVSKEDNLFICFNTSCNEAGTLYTLVERMTGGSYYQNVRMLESVKNSDTFQVKLKSAEERKPDLVTMPDGLLERLHEDLKQTPAAVDFLVNKRGINKETIEHFKIGYSTQQRLVVTPMFDYNGTHIGGIGRSIEGKVFKNIPGTKTSQSLFNIHNAKKHDWVIIVESNFDAALIHQAGYPNVVATCGGHFSTLHMQQIARCFNKVVIMTDWDEKIIQPGVCRKCQKAGLKFCKGHRAGRDLGDKIAEECLKSGVIPRWAAEGCGIIYGDGIKDAGDMTPDQIRKVIDNNISNFEYSTLNQVKEYRR